MKENRMLQFVRTGQAKSRLDKFKAAQEKLVGIKLKWPQVFEILLNKAKAD